MAVGNIVPLPLLPQLRRSGRTDPHQTGDDYATLFLLSPEPVEGSKHEWNNCRF